MFCRYLAGVLAVGGCGWGLFCLVLIVACPGAILFFAPGYLVTLGYIWRAIDPPDTEARQMIWGWSCIVQGAWLVLLGFSVISNGRNFTDPFCFLATGWWVNAFALSVSGLCVDAEEAVGGESPGLPT